MKKWLSAILATIMILSMIPAFAETTYSESPVLADKVASGAIPAVADRLPAAEDIMVETGIEVGKYFADMTFAQGGSKWYPGMIGEEPLFRFKTDGTVEPNVAKAYDVNEDATQYTIYLRKDMKWSDGVPFTSEDCRFFYEDLLIPGVTTNAVWNAVYSSNPETGEKDPEPAKIEVIDEYTFKMTFQHSKPTFLQELAINGKWFFAPKHWIVNYLYLPNGGGLTEEAAVAKASEMGYSDQKSYNKSLTYYYWLVVGRPTLRPWLIQNDPEDQLITWARNPYFWKVDEQGQQLPYADGLSFMRYADDTQPLLWTLDGTLDVNGVGFANIVELMDNKENGGYTLHEWTNTSWAGNSMQLNQAILDLDLRGLFQNVDFRHALSIAVDRETIAALVTDGFATPSQSAPQQGQQGYDPEWIEKWTEYAPAEAEELLVKCGLVKKDGFYYFENGKQVVLNLQYMDENVSALAELLVKYFTEIGIKTTSRVYDRSILEEMRRANTHEVTLNWEAFSTVSIALRPDYIVPTRDYPPWATAFGLWYLNGESEGAVEPTAEVKQLLALYEKLNATVDPEERVTVSLEMLELHKENIWQIGFTAPEATLIAVNSKMHNFPDASVYCDEFRNLGIAHPLTWWIEE